jgi:hypothetical protein
MDRSRADRILFDWDMASRQASRPALPPRTVVTTARPGPALAGVAVLVVAIAAASVWLGLPRGGSSPGVEASASPTAAWGPLAVVPPSDLVMEARAVGTLHITDTCVFLEEAGDELVLLVWPADRTTWHAATQTITLADLDGSTVTLRDGDRVALGGGGDSEAESGVSGEEWVSRTEWVAPPASSCPLDSRWFVGEMASLVEPSGSAVVQLPTWPEKPVSGLCPAALLGGVTLRGDPTNQSRPVWVESRGGGRLTVVWPYGFSARFSPGLELLDSEGEVVAREGDLLDLGGGVVASLDPAYDFYACRVIAAAASPDWTWGPLAVIPPPDGTDLAQNEGTLRITDACLYLESPGGPWLLVWPADRTTWSEESRSITFENYAAFDGSIVTVVDGDRIVLGGGGSSEAESGVSREEWVRRIDWVAPPSSSCSLDPRFFVGAVETGR